MFLEFYTEAGYDVLTIYDGPSSLSTEIGTVSGQYSSGPVYFSSGTSMWFEFSSDSSNTRRGFHANYTAIHGAGMWTDTIKKVSCHGKRIARKHFESRSVPEGNTLIRPSSLWTPPEDTIMKTSKTLISHEIKKFGVLFEGWLIKARECCLYCVDTILMRCRTLRLLYCFWLGSTKDWPPVFWTSPSRFYKLVIRPGCIIPGQLGESIG